MSSGQGNCEDGTAMSSEDEDWETMLDSLIISADEDTGDELDAITESNLSTPDGGAEDGGLVDGPDDAQLAHLSTAPVMGEWTMDVRAPTSLLLNESLTGVQGCAVFPCRAEFRR
ncbi:hypothetical protein KIN20_001736 [Parelaphostrongylus tenuis]|uniref:Uncharacterized protein n=1 Tax=Parelaphostrongylus tenuis TaxID=148309 RepID=A0AAD5LYT1_PARTN|nr:hypothetical protein KIN20_001736 [Parelaphostrongylus tenuis]